VRYRSEIILDRHLKQFGHIARSSEPILGFPGMDYRQALRAIIIGPPASWRRRRGRPSQRYRTVESDLWPAVSLHMAWHRARDHTDWNILMKTAMLHIGAHRLHGSVSCY